MSLSMKQKKDWAKLLFLKTDNTQHEIAKTVGVTDKTLHVWKKKEKWDMLKASYVITKEEELRRIYAQIRELNTSIESREEGKKFASGKEADTLSKLAAAAKNLEQNLSIAEIIDSFIVFTDWLREVDLEKAQEISSLMDSFIKHRLKKYG